MLKRTRAKPAGSAGSAASREGLGTLPGFPSKISPLVVAVAAVLASAAALAMPVIVRVPVTKPHGKADPTEPGVFSHWLHDEYSCTACHPTIFPKARVGFTHDDMDEGKFCGACHNGQSAPPASGERAACRSTCHAQ